MIGNVPFKIRWTFSNPTPNINAGALSDYKAAQHLQNQLRKVQELLRPLSAELGARRAFSAAAIDDPQSALSAGGTSDASASAAAGAESSADCATLWRALHVGSAP